MANVENHKPASSPAQASAQSAKLVRLQSNIKTPDPFIRSKYWSEALTIRHETYHLDDWEGNYFRPMIPDVEVEIELTESTVTLDNLDPTAVLNDKRGTFDNVYSDAFGFAWLNPDPDGYYQGAEERAYADVKDDFQALADSIEL
jgi:hypothetical protein